MERRRRTAPLDGPHLAIGRCRTAKGGRGGAGKAGAWLKKIGGRNERRKYDVEGEERSKWKWRQFRCTIEEQAGRSEGGGLAPGAKKEKVCGKEEDMNVKRKD